MLVDLSVVTAGSTPGGLAPADQETVLVEELRRYQPALLDRPRLVVGSKADLAAADLDWTGPRISAVTGEGVRPLLGRLADLVTDARAALPPSGSFVIHRPLPEGFTIGRGPDGTFVVTGRPVERAVALSDLTDAGAVAFAQQRLRRLGVDRALSRAGARSGDLVRIGGFEFEYEPD